MATPTTPQAAPHIPGKREIPKLFADHILNLTRIHLLDTLGLERPSILASLEHAARVHRPLKRVTLPAKNVVCVGAIPEGVVVTHNERIRGTCRPHVVELGRIPYGLIGELGNANWMRCGAGAGVLEGVSDGVVHVRLVVGRVERFSIPARREVMDGHDATLAGRCGERIELGESGTQVDQANKLEAERLLSFRVGVTDDHSESRCESSHFDITIGTEILLRVVDRHATVDWSGECAVLHEWDALIGAILVLEEHDCSPIVGEVLGECASGASSLASDISSHVGVQGVSTNELVDMARRCLSRLYERVEALDG